MTTKTNIEAMALSDEQKKQIAAIVHRDCTLIPGANFYTAAELAIQATVAQLNRALLASKPAVPEGWKLIRVNEHFDALITALERAESKGYLPDAMAEEWANFACDENVDAPAQSCGEDSIYSFERCGIKPTPQPIPQFADAPSFDPLARMASGPELQERLRAAQSCGDAEQADEAVTK